MRSIDPYHGPFLQILVSNSPQESWKNYEKCHDILWTRRHGLPKNMVLRDGTSSSQKFDPFSTNFSGNQTPKKPFPANHPVMNLAPRIDLLVNLLHGPTTPLSAKLGGFNSMDVYKNSIDGKLTAGFFIQFFGGVGWNSLYIIHPRSLT